MEPKANTEQIWVSLQTAPKDLGEVAMLGFRSVICNRPDGEAAGWVEVDQAPSVTRPMTTSGRSATL